MKEILFFSSNTCKPCESVKRILSEEIINELNIKQYTAESDFEVFIKYEVMSVPTFIVLENNNVIHKTYGAKNLKELRNL